MKIMPFFAWFFLVFFTLGIQFSAALSLSGKSISPITYMPDATITNHYQISGTNNPVDILVDNSTFKYLSINKISDDEFDLIIYFPPEELIQPGSYNFGLTVTEKGSSTETVSGKVSVSKSFEVKVYSYEKEVQVILNAPNINQGEETPLQLVVTSLSYADIQKVQGEITIFDSSPQQVSSILTETKPLPALKTIAFNPSINTPSWPPGPYTASAVITYDGKIKTAKATFLIGEQDLTVLNYTSELETGFSEFNATIRNNWGRVLSNVYAKLWINDTELLQTPSINLNPWEENTLQGIARVEVVPNNYTGILELHFDDKTKEVPLPITVRSPALGKAENTNFPFYIIISIIMALILIIILSLITRKKKSS